MPTDPAYAENDVPRRARRFLALCQDHESDLREQMKLRLEMYIGQGLQWDEKERNRRRGKRPMLEINEIAPPIAQLETDIRINPPGPVCHPVSDGATAETADVISGLIRQTEYACDAKTAYVGVGKHAAISGYAVLEWGTRYVDDRSMDQELYVIPNPDHLVWYFDPLARGENREDALRALKGPRILSREAFELEYGKKCKVLDQSKARTWAGNVQGMFGWAGDAQSINTWTTGGKGPFWVAEYWEVQVKLKRFRVYTDNVCRFDSEAKNLPPGVIPKTDSEGSDAEYSRMVPQRTCTKYVVDACEVRKSVEWIDEYIPALTVLGPEIYIEGKLYRGSLVAGMIDPQRALNYTCTSMMEIAGKTPRNPYVGPEGSFDDLGADGVNKWATANTEDHAWLAYKPVFIVDEVTGRTILAPPPSRTNMEAAIQWCLQLASFFKDAIQAASAYSATSLGKRTADQSGEAIRALQAESNKGTFSYPDGVRTAVAMMYQRWLKIFPKIMDEARAATVIGADGENEQKLINQDFPHPGGGQNADGTPKTMRHDIALGRYSVRVDAGPSVADRNTAAQSNLESLFKAAPQLLQIPGVAAAYLRLVGDGNPKTSAIADLLPGGQGDAPNPAALQGQLQQSQQKIQELVQMLQKMHQEAEAGIPKLQLEKYKADLAAMVDLAKAEISTKAQDAARGSADALAVAQMAHETASQAVDHEHAAAISTQNAAQAADAAQTAQENQPTPEENAT